MLQLHLMRPCKLPWNGLAWGRELRFIKGFKIFTSTPGKPSSPRPWDALTFISETKRTCEKDFVKIQDSKAKKCWMDQDCICRLNPSCFHISNFLSILHIILITTNHCYPVVWPQGECSNQSTFSIMLTFLDKSLTLVHLIYSPDERWVKTVKKDEWV